MNFTPLESRFLAHLSAGDHPVLAVLRQQLASADVADRTLKARWVVVKIAVPASVPRMPVDSPELCDVGFRHPQVPNGGCATLSVRDGYARELRIDCYTDDWPRDHAGFRLHYIRILRSPREPVEWPEFSDERDMVEVERQLGLD